MLLKMNVCLCSASPCALTTANVMPNILLSETGIRCRDTTTTDERIWLIDSDSLLARMRALGLPRVSLDRGRLRVRGEDAHIFIGSSTDLALGKHEAQQAETNKRKIFSHLPGHPRSTRDAKTRTHMRDLKTPNYPNFRS